MAALKKIKLIVLCMLALLQLFNLANGQTFPSQQVDQSYIPPSPNVEAFQNYGNNSFAMYTGAPAISVPIYDIKLGSLDLPIVLSYNYNGFQPMQDAGWVGLGWNLNVGGVISRIVEGQVDSSRPSGFNYGQYSFVDSVNGDNPNLNNFLGEHYDLAPDIFDVEMTGASGKFFWYNDSAYQLDFDKLLSIHWPYVNSAMTVITDNGTTYIFGAKEVTTSKNYWFGALMDSTAYNSAWLLTSVISADKKDTITLSYTSYTWQQPSINYLNTYVSSDGTQVDLGYDTTVFRVTPSIATQVLSSITYRNGRLTFIPATRTDIHGTYPTLAEMDVIDSLSGATVKKDVFTYGYFGASSTNSADKEHLKLKRLTMVNPLTSTDTLCYKFSYINEFLDSNDVPLKATFGIDDWGYYNGYDDNTSLLPDSTDPYYVNRPNNFAPTNSRDANFDYNSYFALDTIVYPTGGYTALQYEQNVYQDGGSQRAGPGIRVLTATDYDAYKPTPALQKQYTYLADDGVTSTGGLTTVPDYGGYSFVTVTDGATDNYNSYKSEANSGGVGGRCPKFHYWRVTEIVSSGGESHKTDYDYTSFPTLFEDVRLGQKVNYVNDPNTGIFTPVQKVSYNYAVKTDTNFLNAYSYILQETIDHLDRLPIQYTYDYIGDDWTTYWISLASQTTTQFDIHGDSIATTSNYQFNPTTRNLTTIQQAGSDGQLLIKKMKYPEDYVTGLTGNMIASRVLSPVIEEQTWLKRDASDSSLIAGQIVQYDQTLFKPVSIYSVETTSPISALSNETVAGGKYSSLVSSSQYVAKAQITYNTNGLPATAAKSSDMSVSYIWDYRHSKPVAEVKNAAQADIAYCSFEADGTGNWSFSGVASSYPTSPQPPTGNFCYNLGQTGGNITKSGLTSSGTYIVSYWTTNGSSLTITGTQAGYPIQGKTINGWTYFEHKITGQSSVTLSGTGYIDEIRLYPSNAQMTTYTYLPLIGMNTTCDADNRITYYQYDGLGRLYCIKDQDGNIVKTFQYHYKQH